MPIKRRRESSTEIYHVIVKGINKEKIFNQHREKTYFKTIILKHLKNYKVEFYSYCIMSNHAHFIIRAEIQVLSRFMAAILAEYANYYNYKHHRNGHVFQNRFMSECIENEKYFWNCLRYIHLNPVKANMVKRMDRYKFSSVAEYKTQVPIVISEKAIKMYLKNFKNIDEFEVFHDRKDAEIFADIAEDINMQQNEVACLIAEELSRKHNLLLTSQVFEENAIREEYIQGLRQILKISGKKAKELCAMTRNQVDDQ